MSGKTAGFTKGVDYVFRGIGLFYSRPRLWLYAAIPFLFVAAMYTWFFMYLFGDLMPHITSYADNATGFWGWILSASSILLKIIAGTIFAIIAALFASTLFEALGAIFFSYMVRSFERREYPSANHEYPTFSKDVANTLNSILFSSLTAVLMILLAIMGFFIPVIPLVMSVIFVGYRYALSYCSEASFNKGRSIWNSGNFFHERGLLYGFGAMTFILLMIPFVSIFLIPGFVIGGTMMINEET